MDYQEIADETCCLVATGRDSLDHFVDTFEINCAEAKGVADALVAIGDLEPFPGLFTDVLRYRLTRAGAYRAQALLEARSGVARRFDLLDDEIRVLQAVQQPGELRPIVNDRLPDIKDGAVQSILVHLEERGLVVLSGTFQVRVTLTDEGQAVVEAANEPADPGRAA